MKCFHGDNSVYNKTRTVYVNLHYVLVNKVMSEWCHCPATEATHIFLLLHGFQHTKWPREMIESLVDNYSQLDPEMCSKTWNYWLSAVLRNERFDEVFVTSSRSLTLNTFNSYDVDKFRLQKDNPLTKHGKTYSIAKGLTRIKTSEHFLKNNFIPVEIKQLITETIST